MKNLGGVGVDMHHEAVVVAAPVLWLVGRGGGGKVGGGGAAAHVQRVVGGLHQTVGCIVSAASEVGAPYQGGEVMAELHNAAVLWRAVVGGVEYAGGHREVDRLCAGGHIHVALFIEDDFATHLIGIVFPQVGHGVQSVVAAAPHVGAGQQVGAVVAELGDDDVGAVLENYGAGEGIGVAAVEGDIVGT